MADYYDENSNYLFVKKGKDNKLLDYIFVHLDDEHSSFLAHYESYKSDMPLEVYRLKKIDLQEEIPTPSAQTELEGEQSWKKVRINSILPSKWNMFFEYIEEKLKL